MGTYPQPGPYLAYQVPAEAARPTSVTVLSIIGIVFACLSILNHGIGLVLFTVGPAGFGGGPELLPWNMINSAFSLALSLVLLGSAIGCLRLRPWARRWMVAYAWTYTASLLVGVGVSFAYVIPMMKARAQAMARARPLPPGYEVGMYVGAAVMPLLLLAWPIVLLVFMNRARVRTAFGETVSGAGASAPWATAPPWATAGAAPGIPPQAQWPATPQTPPSPGNAWPPQRGG